MSLTIAIDVRHLRDFGIGTYIRSLVHALGACDQVNQYTLIALADDARTLSSLPGNFQVAVYDRRDTDLLDHIAFPLFLRGLSPDVCHIPLNRVPLFMPRPYVVTIHDMASLIFKEHTGIWASVHRVRFRRGLQRAARIFAVSAATRRDVQHLLGIPGDRIRLVYNAPNPDFFTHGRVDADLVKRKRILERYQIQYPFLLYAGNIRPQKNIPRLVEAFAVAREQLAEHPTYKDLRLIIIGDEISHYPSVRRTVIQSRVEQVVRFLGFVPFETLRCFYESAAAFVFPSLYEGFGLPPLEAMASGTPVVTSGISSLPEVVGGAAILVNPENVFDIARGIREVLLDENLRVDLIRRGREHAASYSWERTAREVLEIYLEVAKEK
jgi:glycosyltransferase involved in cell wall biosynthesis